jgi:hypothetical protein
VLYPPAGQIGCFAGEADWLRELNRGHLCDIHGCFLIARTPLFSPVWSTSDGYPWIG